jgi:hypothetical protein
MKICRLIDPETQRPRFGLIEDDAIYTLLGDLAEGNLSLEDRLRRTQLQRARGGAWQRDARGASSLPQSAFGNHR